MSEAAKYNPEMLTLAREAARLSQTDLAGLTPYDQPTVSRMESGQLQITPDAAAHFAKALDVPESFLMQPDRMYGLGASFLFHRKRQSIPNPDLRKIQADVNIVRMHIDRMFNGVPFECENAVDPKEVGLDGTPSDIARLVRAGWQLPNGPVRNLVRAVESAGCFVLFYPYHVTQVDGASLWVTGLPPLFVLNERMPGDRARWTLAHELGHIVMHRNPTQEIEGQADEFASEFLMPAKDIAIDLRELTLPKAALLKLTWGVSMQALVRRAKDVKSITPSRYQSLMVQISRAGFRKVEPNEIPQEMTCNTSRLIEYHFRENHYTVDDLSKLICATTERFRRIYLKNGTAPLLRLTT